MDTTGSYPLPSQYLEGGEEILITPNIIVIVPSEVLHESRKSKVS